MTHSPPVPTRKRRWLGLWLPYALVAALALAWSLGWLWLRRETERQLTATAASYRTHGGAASWSSLRLGGYPFRLDADFTDLQVADPSGWSAALPSLKTEAYIFSPTHWIIATDQGLTFTRPGAPPVHIAATLLRASINSWDEHPPRISFVGDDLAFSGPPGAFPLASAKDMQFYTRAGPDDQGALLLQIDGGAAAPGSSLGKLADGPIDLTIDAIASHVSALAGPGWRAAASNWSRAGGQLTLQHLNFSAGTTSVTAARGALGLDPEGRFAGQIDAAITYRDATSHAPLVFQTGAARLGPLTLGPAPRAY